MFTITAITHRNSCFEAHPHWHVTVEMPAEAWHKLRKAGELGQLYGIDISNAVHRANPAVPAYNPTVDDRQRAIRGRKHISLFYYERE